MIPRLILLAAVFSVALCEKQLQCQKCDSAQGDCNGGVCSGVWCTATVTENKSTRSRSVHKDCTNSTNPANLKDDGCQRDTLSDGSEVYRCGCNSADNCNSESGIWRMQSMLNNQFSFAAGGAQLPGPPGQPGSSNPASAGQPSNGQPSIGQAPNGQPPQLPSNAANPSSTFTDVIAGQPTPFPGANPNPPPLQPNQVQPASNTRNSPPQSGLGNQPNSQVPLSNANQPQVLPGGANVPPQSPNPNKPIGRPGQGETDSNFVGGPTNGAAPNSNLVDVHSSLGNESNKIPSDNHPTQPPTSDLGGQSRAGPVSGKNGQRTCACTEPSCTGPCKGEACYQMMFSASDVHSQAFAGKEGQIIQSGCTSDPNVITGGTHHVHRQLADYKFKAHGQEITVPASAFYCNDVDFCNGAATVFASFIVPITAVLSVVLFMRF